MRIVRLSGLKQEALLARSLYASDGRVLLAQGSPIDRFAERLQNLGIHLVYVESESGEHLDVDDSVREETRVRGIKAVRTCLDVLAIRGDTELSDVMQTVDEIIDEVSRDPSHQVQLVEIRAMNDYTFGHSVSVCVLSVLMGRTLGLAPARLKVLGTGALLHDIGRARIAPWVWAKRGRLSPKDRELVQAHPEQGFQALRGVHEVSLIAAHIAYQHHERLDGSGYPRGLAGGEIHELARIVAVADVFDALTSDRAHRPRVYPIQALEYLISRAGTDFDPECVRALAKSVAPYPIGAKVILNTGDTGTVVRNHKGLPFRPIVSIAGEGDDGMTKDLGVNPELVITHVLPDFS